MITTHDPAPTIMMRTHDRTPTVMMTAQDRIPAAALAGNTAMGAALAGFERRYPAYAGTAVLDGMRARDYTRLDATGHVYLDYTGGGLYAESQLARHRDLLAGAVFVARHLQAAAPVRGRRLERRPGPAAGSLFAFPAQSNFSGVQHPLTWIAQAQAAGYDVLLDAAAFAPTSRLDLSRWHPDYVSLSFYKIFGYPTGIGALLVRKPALAKLRRPWYAALPGVPPCDRREDHRRGAGLARPGHHLRRRLPVLGIRRRFPRHPLPRGRGIGQ